MNRRTVVAGAALGGLGAAVPAMADATPTAMPAAYQPIADLLAATEALADEHGFTDPKLRAAVRRHVLMSMSGGSEEMWGTNPDTPDWVPYIPYYSPRAGANPDTVYRFAPVDPNGVYRLSGKRGTDALANVTLRKGGIHLGSRPTIRTGEIDLHALPVDEDGHFDMILSATRPEGWTGHWVAMAPGTTCLMSRTVSKTMDQVETVCGLQRLDKPAGSLLITPEELPHKLELIAGYVKSQVTQGLSYLPGLKKRGADKGFMLDDQTAYGGIVDQLYHFHVFNFAADEALILESNDPGHCSYWSIQLMDPLARSIEFVLHQSSFNDAQAVKDRDGKIRMVVSLQDPGFTNWLDPAGWNEGGILWRWNAPEIVPMPTVTRVKVSELAGKLPSSPRVTPEQRRAIMAEHIAYYQSRRR